MNLMNFVGYFMVLLILLPVHKAWSKPSPFHQVSFADTIYMSEQTDLEYPTTKNRPQGRRQ